jgi:hypothetical protein
VGSTPGVLTIAVMSGSGVRPERREPSVEEEPTWSIGLEADERLGRVTGRPGIQEIACSASDPRPQ